MTYRQFEHVYKRERMILSVGFAVLMLAIGFASMAQSPDGFWISAAEAVEYSSTIVSDVFRGVAP